MLKRSFRNPLLLTCLASAIAAAASPASAQTYPSGTIRFVVGNAAGAPPDIMGRIVASELSENEGWRAIVENRPGAITTIALGDVLKQPADGHTLASISLPSAAATALLPNTPNFGSTPISRR